MTDIKICEVCRKSVPQKEIEQGLAIERNGKWICGHCSDIGRKHKDPFQQDVLAAFEKSTEEIRSISRAISYKEASVWTVFGAVLQIFVIFSVIVSFTQMKTIPVAYWWMGFAIVLQIMAHTFFSLGR